MDSRAEFEHYYPVSEFIYWSKEIAMYVAASKGARDVAVSQNNRLEAWQASRQGLSSCSENPNSSDRIADAGEMVKGNAVAMGEIVDEHGAIYGRSMMIQFGCDDDIRAAIKSGQCRFTVFGGAL